MSERLTIESAAGPVTCYVAQPSGPGAGGPGVLVLHAWWGLTDHFKRVCDRLASNGYVALAPDLFRGQTAETPERAEQLVHGADGRECFAMVSAALARLKERASGKTGVVGFSFGGYFVVQVALEQPGEVAAIVPFYTDHDLDVSAVPAAQQWHFAEKDEFVPHEWRTDFEQTVAALGRSDVELYVYPGTEHAFFNVSRHEAYKKEAAELAWERMLAFFAKYLQ
jgi:carboxymethylenebutenolidase